MISIIICSARAKDLQEVKLNIAETIGVPYEIIAYDNSDGKRGICELYNNGTRQARFDTICFMHEDIEIKTENWGNIVLNIFSENREIGVIGVAGGGYKALAPSGWYCVEYNSPDRYFQNFLQGFKYKIQEEIYAYNNPYQQKLSEVVCVDGMWFCTKKSVLKDKTFDEDMLKSFHGYDVDFCLGVFRKHKIVVTYDILMKHFSEGNFNKSWLNELLKVHSKWSKHLPLTITKSPSEVDLYNTEKRALKHMVEQMLKWDYSFYAIHRMLVSVAKSRKMPLRLFFKGYVHLIEQRVKLKDLTESA